MAFLKQKVRARRSFWAGIERTCDALQRTLVSNQHEVEEEIEHLETSPNVERNRDIIVTLKAAAEAYDNRLNCIMTAINALNWALGDRSDVIPIVPNIEAARPQPLLVVTTSFPPTESLPSPLLKKKEKYVRFIEEERGRGRERF